MRAKSLFLLIPVLLMSIFYFSCTSQTKNDKLQSSVSMLKDDWKIISSEKISETGSVISSSAYEPKDWYNAKVPGTVLANLVADGVYKDIYFAKNLETIDTAQFRKNWWYRKEFEVVKKDENIYRLLFEGLNYRANIWLNGKQIAEAKTTESPYKMFEYQVTENLVEGKNVLAVEIVPPVFNDLTIGFVDWNPTPPDNNMGLWRPVKLIETGKIAIDDVFVQTDVNTETLKSAEIKISANIKNYASAEKEATIDLKIGDISISTKVKLQANEEKAIELSAKDFPELKIENPKLWWPNGLGEPNLYSLKISATAENNVSDEQTIRFGIREIGQYLNENGHKGWLVNGQKVLIKGAGWVDDMLLSNTDENVEDQMDYVQHMNLNTVRLEGFWGNNKRLYDAADEHGLLLMIGWSCQWEWNGYCHREETDFMCITSEHDMKTQTEGYLDQVKWLRNHPSIFLWVFGSDKLPLPELEQMLEDGLAKYDGTRPTLASCKGQDFGTDKFNDSKISGKVGVKMLGPYAYVTPNYWYEDVQAGGAYGFNTETGPGPQVPPIESIKKMIPQADLFDITGDMWQYHCGRNEFQTLNRYLTAFDARYGKATSAEDFAQFSQVSNYEAIRPMYEAFSVNKFNSTGVIQWMLNSAWPEMYWQLYDWYLMPNGAFYGVKDACKPVNAIYNYKDKAIYITNELASEQSNLILEAKVYDFNSKELFSKELSLSAKANASEKVLEFPKLANLTSVYFINLKLTDSEGLEISNKIYWLSTKEDVLDFKNSNWFSTPNKSFADLTDLRKMEKVVVEENHTFTEEGEFVLAKVELKNTSDKIAFMLELLIVGSNDGQSILPVFWNDNYISLLPNETRVLTAKIRKNKLNGQKPVLKISGVNMK